MTAKAPILVQRLADQRLYHVALDRYITVAAPRAWQAAGMSFVVRDAQTGDNVTSSVMRLH
jgi:polyhydroxyalkanoate synthesis regulator protein